MYVCEGGGTLTVRGVVPWSKGSGRARAPGQGGGAKGEGGADPGGGLFESKREGGVERC